MLAQMQRVDRGGILELRSWRGLAIWGLEIPKTGKSQFGDFLLEEDLHFNLTGVTFAISRMKDTC